MMPAWARTASRAGLVLRRVGAALLLIVTTVVATPSPALAAPFEVSFAAAASTSGEPDTHAVAVTLSTGGANTTGPITVEVSDTGGGSAGAGDYSFTTTQLTFPTDTADGATRNVLVTVGTDSTHEGDETVELALTVTDPGPDGATAVAPSSHTVTIDDDDDAVVSFSAATSSTAEAGSHAVVVDLTIPGGTSLAAQVVVDIVDDLTGSAAPPGDYTLATTSLTFAAGTGATSRDVDLTIGPDQIDENAESVDLSLAVSAGPAIAAGGGHSVTINDNDTAGVDVNPLSVSVTEGQPGAQYAVVLESQPTANVTITPSDSDGEVSVTPASRTYTPANWNTAQSFTVNAVNDAIADGTTSDTVTHAIFSGDANYDTFAVPDVDATVADNDSAGVSLPTSSLAITEGGAAGTYTVVLTSAPTQNVTISPTAENSIAQVSPVSRTFTTVNWQTPKQFTVTVTDDEIAQGARNDTITHDASSGDDDYDNVAVGSVAVSIADDDAPSVIVNITSVTVTEGQTGISYTVRLGSEPAANVTINPVDTTGEASVSPGSRVFTPGNWDTRKTFTISAVNDDIVDGTMADMITHLASSGGDPAYNGMVGPSIAVTANDDDDAGVTVSPTSVGVTEGGAGDTYTVVLESEPEGDVTITPSDVNGEVVISPPSLTFTDDNWDTVQSFTVTAPDNALADGNRADTIAHMATSIDDSLYDGIAVASVAVAITDDEGLAAATIEDVTASESDGAVVYTFTITVDPPAPGATSVRVRTVPPLAGNPADPGGEYEVLTNRLVTIPALASSVDFDVDAFGDNLVEPDERFRVELFNPTGGLVANDAARATIVDDDSPPSGTPDSYNVDEGGSLTTNVVTGVLANDTDADDGQAALTAVLVAPPSNHVGGFTLAPDGTFTYNHDGSTGSSDTFTHRASDGSNQSTVVQVTITIDNVAPLVDAGPDPAPVAENDAVPVNATFFDPGLSDSHSATIDWGDGTIHNCANPACAITFDNQTGNGTVAGSHAFADTGVYTVTVRVSDGAANHSDTFAVTVTSANLTVTAGGNQDVDEGDIVEVDAAWVDADGSGVHTATIDWGDGSPVQNCPPACTMADNGNGTGTVSGSHVYADNGTYTVVITVRDNSGDEGSGGFTANVANVPPIASITGPISADEGDAISLTGNRVDPGADTFTWDWQVTRDGEFFTSATTKNLNVVADDDGVYEFSFTVTDDDGGVSNTANHTVVVTNVAPSVAITDVTGNPLPPSSVHGEEGDLIRLRSQVTDPGAEEFTYDWTIRLLGQVVASGTDPGINYRPIENGTYFVTLGVDDGDGGADTDSALVLVTNAPPAIDAIAFDATPAIGAEVDLDVYFSDRGTQDIHTVRVNWGDGSVATSGGASPQSFAHTYNSGSTRSAEVCVTDDDNGQTCETFYVNPGVVFSIDSDFDGNGYEDLPIGVPGEDGFGAVNVLYGTSTGLGTGGDDVWKQGADGIGGTGEAGDSFGSELAWGDFNLDGYSDLAVGVPGEDLGGEIDVGLVHVIYGSAAGLTGTGDAFFHQDSFGVSGGNQPGDRFGEALASGDFNNDGFADLAIGVPGEDTGGNANTGRIGVLFGSPSGLVATGDELWDQNSPRVLGVNRPGDSMGAALAAGDFDLDGAWDVVVGIPKKNAAGEADSGAVLVIGGSVTGLDPTADQWWHQDIGTLKNTADDNDEFGSVLAVGDFNGDGRPDLAVGVPEESYSSRPFAGGVALLLGASGGLTDAGNTFWHENVPGVKGVVKGGDRFGFALAAGDFNADGRDDLAIGVPYQEIGVKKNAGDVAVLLGGVNGLRVSGDQRWNENSPGIKGVSAKADHLGWALRAFDQGGDGDADLAIGIPDQNVSGDSNAGAVLVLKGRPGGITAVGDTYWHQDITGVREATGQADKFGKAM